ncbi:O-acetylhomoserine/O-acetylserine sulfhydrylase-like pyridoxal-dependent enzyme [Bradyrhizobium sp. USDA 4449]
MRNETIAIHAGYEPEATTHAVAVPIYQTAAYAFDSADHGAALFNLEAEGFRYSRIANPTSAVLEKRIAQLEGGVGALAVATGQAALHFALVNVADHGGNIVSVPQLYGTTHTLLSHILPRQGITGRFAESDAPDAIAKLIDENTRAVFAETIGNPAGNVCDIEALAKVAHAHGVPLIVDNTVATPILLKPFDYGADIAVHSLTKFLGGHGTTLGGAIVDSGNFPWAAHADRFPAYNEPDASYHGLVYAERFGKTAYIERAQRLSAHDGLGAVAVQRLPAAPGHRDRGAAHGAPLRERPQGRRIPAQGSPRRLGELHGLPGQPILSAGPEIPRRQCFIAVHVRHQGGHGSRQDLL